MTTVRCACNDPNCHRRIEFLPVEEWPLNYTSGGRFPGVPGMAAVYVAGEPGEFPGPMWLDDETLSRLIGELMATQYRLRLEKEKNR